VTAIQEADSDGNPDTVGDPTWTPLQQTYPMPDYDSAHSVEGGAAAEVLRQFFGTDAIPFTACSLSLPAGQTCDDPASTPHAPRPAEFVGDQLPSTPSRTVPMQFGARLLSGAMCGAAIGSPHGAMLGGLLAGIVGAVIGTLAGHAFRLRLAAAFKKDPPAAFVEDAIAIGGAWLIVQTLS
jgi:hypothetical protein